MQLNFVLNSGAEGYFTLVLCAYRFLISWHYHNFESHNSWLEPRFPPGTPWTKRFAESLSLYHKDKGFGGSPMTYMHYFLIAANAIIISGGSRTAGASARLQSGEFDEAAFNKILNEAKIYRTTGQAIFLTINGLLLLCIIKTMRQYRAEQGPAKRMHPTLWILLITSPLLFIRGIYGVLAGIVPTFNYFAPQNYTAHGLSDGFVISEYILGTTMEWVPCVLLVATKWTSKGDPPKGELKEWEGIGLTEKKHDQSSEQSQARAENSNV
jgi:hypothetical protein